MSDKEMEKRAREVMIQFLTEHAICQSYQIQRDIQFSLFLSFSSGPVKYESDSVVLPSKVTAILISS